MPKNITSNIDKTNAKTKLKKSRVMGSVHLQSEADSKNCAIINPNESIKESIQNIGFLENIRYMSNEIAATLEDKFCLKVPAKTSTK